MWSIYQTSTISTTCVMRWTISVLLAVIIETIFHITETSMENGVVILFAVVSAAILASLLIVYKRQKRPSDRPITVPSVPPAVHKPRETHRPPPPAVSLQTKTSNPPVSSPPQVEAVPAAPAVRIDLEGAFAGREDRNEQILAGISKNIQKTLQTRIVPQHSLIPYSELKPRDTEYVRVKRDIITPHGDIRFSILKDWVATNMLAVFRRASLEWKTPNDLIALLPPYLEGEAEILNGEVLLIGTSGHAEKLAVPIRKIGATSILRNCFDFVANEGTATNSPAVLLPSDTEFHVISRGVISETAFMNAIGRGQPDTRLLIERSPETLTV